MRKHDLVKRECQFNYALDSQRNQSALILWMMKRKILPFVCLGQTHLWPFSKSKFNIKSDRVNLVASASPIECLLYLPNVRAIQYKLGPERLTQLGNSNVLRVLFISFLIHRKNWWTQARFDVCDHFFQAPGIKFPEELSILTLIRLLHQIVIFFLISLYSNLGYFMYFSLFLIFHDFFFFIFIA